MLNFISNYKKIKYSIIMMKFYKPVNILLKTLNNQIKSFKQIKFIIKKIIQLQYQFTPNKNKNYFLKN